MKRTYKIIDGKCVEVTPKAQLRLHEIMPDIKPYQSMITGERIRSRSHHKQHLRDHECTEVGNDVDKQFHAYDDLHSHLDESRHEIIKAQFNDMTHDEFKKMINKSVRQARGH